MVDGVPERIPELRIEECLGRRSAVRDRLAGVRPVLVERELRPAVGAARDRLDVRIGLQLVELVGVGAVRVVELTRLEGLDHGVTGLVDDDVDLVREPLLAPVVRIALVADELAGLPFDGLIRAGPDERRRELGLADRLVRLLAPDVLGDDRDRDLEHPVGRVVGRRDQRRRVRARDRGHPGVLHGRFEIAGAEGHLGLDGLDADAPREAGIGRRGRFAVGPLHPVADVEDPGVAVGGPLPPVGVRADRLEVRTGIDHVVVGQPERLIARPPGSWRTD